MLSTLIKAIKNHLKRMSFGSFVLLPNITGEINKNTSHAKAQFLSDCIPLCTGAFSVTTISTFAIPDYSDASNLPNAIQFNANSSNAIYADSITTVQPKALIFNYVIKY